MTTGSLCPIRPAYVGIGVLESHALKIFNTRREIKRMTIDQRPIVGSSGADACEKAGNFGLEFAGARR